MPYVRTRGSQLLLVNGFRDEEKKVNQQILFTIFSKPEALDIIGKRQTGNPHYFRNLMEDNYPTIKFNWQKIDKAIEEQMHILPDLYQYKYERTQKNFRKDMSAFLRQIACADPYSTLSTAQLYQENRFELEFICELIKSRIICSQNETINDFNGDNPFYWRQSIKVPTPHEIEELASGYFSNGDYARAEAIFKFLTETFEDYAEGFNYLGLIALEQHNLEKAAHFFRETILVGRKLFPKKIAKSSYWNDHKTRPYMRGLRNLSLILIRQEKYDEALKICKQLENECSDDITAATFSSDIFLNLGLWQQALDKALYCNQIFKYMNFNIAFAYLGLNEIENAKAHFLCAALNYPFAAHNIIGLKNKDLKKYIALTVEEKHDPDIANVLHVNLNKYLSSNKVRINKCFYDFLMSDDIQELFFARSEAMKKWEARQGDGIKEGFDKMEDMGSLKFAKNVVQRFC